MGFSHLALDVGADLKNVIMVELDGVKLLNLEGLNATMARYALITVAVEQFTACHSVAPDRQGPNSPYLP